MPEVTDADHALLHDMAGDYREVTKPGIRGRRVVEAYHDATFDRDRAQDLFNSGVLSLRGRAAAEQIYYAILNAVARIATAIRAATMRFVPLSRPRSSTATSATSRYSNRCPTAGPSTSCSPSFLSIASTEQPTRRATLQDITCDSDGKIDQFVGRGRSVAQSGCAPVSG